MVLIVRPRGRAAASKATEKSKSDLEDMSNLGKKKRRPSTPAKASKRKAEEIIEEEPAKKTRSRKK